jgi:uncharacterized damage-inducible protein DinB
MIDELVRPAWAERRFAFVHPLWMLPDFTERLRGLLPRLSELLGEVDHATAHRQMEGSWSIAQNAGHLADVEELWQERLEDLRARRAVYTPAVPARFQAAANRHIDRPISDILDELAERRGALVRALEAAPVELQTASAYHERLQCPMRLIDCAQFYAEHDDHHVLRIRMLREVFQGSVRPRG